nr:rhomboid-related protein 4-like isoform X1 [Pelodiscus sinensis]|eukprot:XP_025036220.1 rhomboid-related protein 4-like isoform X1 [Pelodiscus sinensis]
MSMPQPSLATLLLVALNVGLYLRPLGPPENTCLSMQGVWDLGQWQRLFLAPFHHLGWGHLGLNMGALLWLGGVLEARVGSAQAGWLLGAMTLLGGLVHLGLNAGLAALRGDSRHWKHCAVGFSGVIFSLEAMEGFLEPITIATMGSITITTKWLCLAECLTVSLLYPRSSLTGHLSGLLVGLVLAATPLFTSL